MSDQWLEELSFYNLVHFYQDELRRLVGGESAKTVFPTDNERSRLLRYGILYRTYQGGHVTLISSEANAILEGLPDE